LTDLLYLLRALVLQAQS